MRHRPQLRWVSGVVRCAPRRTRCSCLPSASAPTSRRLLTCVAAGTRSWQGHRASTRRPASLFPPAPAVFVREPVAQPRALRIAATLHGDLVTRAPAVLAGRRGRVGRLAGGRGLVLAGGRLGGQGLLHRLLNQGLHVGRRAHRRDRGGGGGTAACPAAASRCWRSVSSWVCRSRAWSTKSCTHGTRCCTRLVSSASVTSRMVYISSNSPICSRTQQLDGASVTAQRSALGRGATWAVARGVASGVLVVRAAVACRWICSASTCLHATPRFCMSGQWQRPSASMR